MALGDSVTLGTGAFAGYRDHLKSILAAWGVGCDFVGSIVTQNGQLSNWSSRDYESEGVSGDTIAQITARVDAAMAAYSPDLVICAPLGHNNVGSTNLAATATATETLISTIRAAKPNVPILVGGLTIRNNSGSISMDANIANVNLGVKAGCLNKPNVAYTDLHAELARNWNAVWNADGTHYNDIGYCRLALCLAKKIMGPNVPPPITAPVSVVSATSISADVDYPQGAYLSSSGGTVKVTTWGGQDLVMVFGGAAGTTGSFPANTITPFPIVRIWNTGSTLGTHTLLAHTCQIGGLR